MNPIISCQTRRENKRNQVLLLVFLMLVSVQMGNGQVPSWRIGLYSFFDNVEFGGSDLKASQTMSGVRLTPEADLRWDSVHSLNAGLGLLHEFGSKKAFDRVYPLIYYEFNRKPIRFVMGSFPRPAELSDYPRLFFQDSVEYYRAEMNGIFVGYRRSNGYLNLWLDWTSHQTETARETFLAGITGRYNLGIFYIRYYGDMFHFARMKSPILEAVHDNFLSLASAGVDLSEKTFLTRLELNAGWVGAAERAGIENTGWILKSGFLSEARAEYKFIGIFNTFYTGSHLMHFYEDHNKDLYWGDPVYRAGIYNRTDIIMRVIGTKSVTGVLTYSFHFLEGKMYHEQLLKVSVNLPVR